MNLGGQEHDVQIQLEFQRVRKTTKRNSYGFHPLRDTESGRIGMRPALPLEYLERLELQNTIFGDDWQLEGAAENAGGSLYVITSQPFVTGQAASLPQIASLMKSLNFTLEDATLGAWSRASDGVLCLDAHPRNLIMDQSNRVLAIDLILGRE